MAAPAAVFNSLVHVPVTGRSAKSANDNRAGKTPEKSCKFSRFGGPESRKYPKKGKYINN